MTRFAYRLSELITGNPVGWKLKWEFIWLRREWHLLVANGCEFWLWTNRINDERRLQFGIALGFIGLTSNMVDR